MLFELREVCLSRGGRQVLDSVSAVIPAGATAVLGPSGSGKSTLLRLLNRLAEPEAGTIAYRGHSLAACDPLALRREVSLVPQLPALLEGTVEAKLLFGAGLGRGGVHPRRCLLPAARAPRRRWGGAHSVRRGRGSEARGGGVRPCVKDGVFLVAGGPDLGA